MPTLSSPSRAIPGRGERVVGTARVLHVDAHEVAPLGSSLHGSLEVLPGDVEIQLQPHPGQLDADVRVEPLLVDRAEHVVVRVGDVPRLLGRGDLLAEDVDRRHLPACVQLLDDATGVLDAVTCDVTLRDPADDRLGDGRRALTMARSSRAAEARSTRAKPLPSSGNKRNGLGEENPHGVAQRNRLLVGPPSAFTCERAAAVRVNAVFSVSVANCHAAPQRLTPPASRRTRAHAYLGVAAERETEAAFRHTVPTGL